MTAAAAETRAGRVAHHFALAGELVAVEHFAGGHINGSWRLTTAGGRRYLLQRINERVFPEPRKVMENVVRVTDHLAASLVREDVPDAARRSLTLVRTQEGDAWYVDADGGTWRLFDFIEATTSVQRATEAGEAYEAARAFGQFQRRLADFQGPRLHETIPGFHDTPRRLAALERAVKADAAGRLSRVRPEVEALRARRALAEVLLGPHRRGEMPERIVHNDAKIANVLFDAATGEARCVVDLDTVMPGLALYDFGDMARSMAGSAEEDGTGGPVTVLEDQFEALGRGYLDVMGGPLTPTERTLLVDAACLITYEQAMRYLTDYLQGDRYYRIASPDQNLDRTRAQLALLEAFLQAVPALRRRLR